MASHMFPASREYASKLVEAFAPGSPAAVCAVINCRSAASDGDDSIKFYPFPTDPMERTIWISLLGRVERSSKPWQITRSEVAFVCSKHFLGNRRLLLPETDHYYPSIFPAILREHCLPAVGPGEKKIALSPRPAGFYKLRPPLPKVAPDDGGILPVYRVTFPELDPSGLKWSELEELAYEQIYLPFANVFNKLIADLQLSEGMVTPQLDEITSRMEVLRTQMGTSLKQLLRAEEQYLTKSEVTIFGTAPASSTSHSVEKARNPHNFVFGPDNTKIPIDVTMPSLIKNWTFTRLRYLRTGQKVFVLGSRAQGNWFLCIVVEVDYTSSRVKVRLPDGSWEKVVPLSTVAYGTPPSTQVQLGCRVLTTYGTRLQPGVVMEYPKWQNDDNYLILLESGQWTYRDQRAIYLICTQTSQTWLHVNREIAAFVKEFFMTTEHPLLRVKVGQKIQAEKDKQWFEAEVTALEGNLIEVAFKHYGKKLASEWLYAGSPRLQDIFSLLNLSEDSTRKHAKRRVVRKSNEPYVEYTDDATDVITVSDDDDDAAENEEDDASGAHQTQHQHQQQLLLQQKKNTARKSTSQLPHIQTRRKAARLTAARDPGLLGSVEKDQVIPLARPRELVSHSCGPSCLPFNDDPLKHTAHSPYLLPYLMGWQRVTLESSKGGTVVYRTPCGRSLANESETLSYLLLTGCRIRIDQFCFDPDFDMYAVWKPRFVNKFIDDITGGVEPYPISLVNGVDAAEDALVPYWSKRRPTQLARRTMNLDEEFLPCCTCEDECLDRSTCECQRLTVAVSDSVTGEIDPQAGYTFKSLSSHQLTGIYECNSRCSCKQQCVNKVAQHGVQVRMQIFKTLKKGYGVRTVHDIPKGRFLCTYAGTVLTDKEAEARGQDTYFAELDYMDVIAQTKNGYESSVSDIEDDLYNSGDSDSEVTQKNLDADALRKLYFGKEDSYVMDALNGGNIGRYFNHSCDPNIFVQNVFVDTHDLRLPWLGFFTDRLIKAGEELTWDYNYEVGSVKGRKLPCYCNSANCRKRLL